MTPVRSLARRAAPLCVCCACCALGAAAHAQHGAALYGALDASAEAVRAGPAGRQGRLSSNSSAFGFRGAEELGGGLRALFQLEGAVNLDQGGGSVNGRDSFVGLAGPAGSLKLGLLTTPLRALGGKLNFVPGASSIANNIGLMATLNGVATNLNARLPNALHYATPALAGALATLVYAPGENRAGGAAGATLGAGLSYAAAALYLGYAYEDRRAQRKLAMGDSRDRGHRLAARYAAGAASVGLGWDRLSSAGLYRGAGGPGRGAAARDAWSASAAHSLGPHELMLHYTRAGALRCSGAADNGQCAPGRRADAAARQVSLLYLYAASKRTQLRLFYSAIDNRRAGAYDFDANPVLAAEAARTPGADPRGAGVGIRHVF